MIKVTSEINSKHPKSSNKMNEDKSKKTKSSAIIKSELDEVKASGLCASCAKKNKCPLTKFEGGVWHCEGYVESGKTTD